MDETKFKKTVGLHNGQRSRTPTSKALKQTWWCLSVCGDKQGRAGQGGQGSRCGGPNEVPFILEKSLGKIGGPASNQTKIQFILNLF
jgi:hypothetical protein